MSTQCNWWGTTLKAADPFNDAKPGTGTLFKAIAVDGTFANNGFDAYGIVQGLQNSGEHLTLGWVGEMKFASGEAIVAGQRLAVATSGYVVAAGSGSHVIGRCAENGVSSGAIGRGLFSFHAPPLYADSQSAIEFINFSAASSLNAASMLGLAMHSNSGDFALEEGGYADGVLVAGADSGGIARMQIMGSVLVRAGDAILQGVSLTVADSGYWVTAAITKNISGRALEASAAANSGSTFLAMVNFATPTWSAVVSDAIVD